MKFIDLFAGLGGFHLALEHLGHECVFACEKNEQLRILYEKNFGIKPVGNIKSVKIEDIPPHDILCAGFPCQPFSKATPTELRTGFDNPKQGDLFDYVVKILRAKKPRYFILENVLHIRKHDNEQTWKKIKEALENAGYAEDCVDETCLSPHQLKIPQIRRRVFIVGDRDGPPHLPREPSPCVERDLKKILDKKILDKNPPDAQPLTNRQMKCLNVWQEFLDLLPKDTKLPSAPIWSMEFGANYPYEETTPYALGVDKLRKFKGNHGKSLENFTDDEVWQNLPSYAGKNRPQEQFPAWKIRFIKENRDFYENNKGWINDWKQKLLEFPPSYQKFEWNCKTEDRDQWNLWQFLIQFRASGIRVKRATTAPSLVAMSVHVPIIGREKRYMTVRECARLQSLPDDLELPEPPSRAFTALGNAVNVKVVQHIAKVLTSDSEECINKEKQLDLPIDVEND
jgi:DNA (cytosine-5)-methyltransferase 1